MPNRKGINPEPDILRALTAFLICSSVVPFRSYSDFLHPAFSAEDIAQHPAS
jgi:hypothetical protein